MRLLLLALALAGTAAAHTPAVLEARQSAVQIIQQEGQTYTAICSGAAVKLTRGARILSAGHCLSETEGKGRYLAYDHAGRLWPLYLEEWALRGAAADHAVFRSLATLVLPALNVAPSACRVGEGIHVWAGPMGLNLLLFGGKVAGTLHAPFDREGEATVGGLLYSADLETAGGASGSVALNDAGEAVGILMGTWGQHIKLDGAFFVPLPR